MRILYPSLQQPVPTISLTGNGGLNAEWMQEFRNPVWPKVGLGNARQQFYTTDPTIIPPRMDSWLYQLSDPVRTKSGLHSRLQREFFAEPVSLTLKERVTADRWAQPWSLPVWKRVHRTALQQAYLTSATSLMLAENVPLDRYVYQLSIPVRRRHRIGTALAVSRENNRSELE